MMKKIIILSLLAALLLLIVGCSQEQLTPEEKELFGEGGAIAGQAVSYDVTRLKGCLKDKKCASNFIVCHRAECSKTKDSSACINKCLDKVLGGKVKPLTFINVKALTGSESENQISIAWGELKSLKFDPNKPLVLAGPLRLAALTFQKELEKNLGPSFVSEVEGLPSISYTGDIITDKLFFEYVETLMDFNSIASDNPEETWQVLEKITRQVASLSANQLIDLDFAIYDAFQVSSARLKEMGIDENEFLRVMTPAFLLVYDATKNHGANSQIYHLYKENGAGLVTLAGQKGLPMNYLPAYDRISGVLVGMPVCGKGKMPKDGCVDAKTLFESLQEPRALGLGYCALGNMLAKGTEKVEIATTDSSGKVVSREDKELYTCPTDKCGDPEQSKDNLQKALGRWAPGDPEGAVSLSVSLFESGESGGGGGGGEKGAVSLPEDAGGRGGIPEIPGVTCRDGSSNSQGGFSGASSAGGCLNSNIFQPEVGRDYMACASDPFSPVTAGGLRDMFLGVPMSKDCMLIDEPALDYGSESGEPAGGFSGEPPSETSEEPEDEEKKTSDMPETSESPGEPTDADKEAEAAAQAEAEAEADKNTWVRREYSEDDISYYRTYQDEDGNFVMETKDYNGDGDYVWGGSTTLTPNGYETKEEKWNDNTNSFECTGGCSDLDSLQPSVEHGDNIVERFSPLYPYESPRPGESSEERRERRFNMGTRVGDCPPDNDLCGSTCGGLPSQVTETRDCFREQYEAEMEEARQGGVRDRGGIAPIDPIDEGSPVAGAYGISAQACSFSTPRNGGTCSAVDCPPDTAGSVVGAGECCGQSPVVMQRRDRLCDVARSVALEMNPSSGRCPGPLP